jgi:hypothetical protein
MLRKAVLVRRRGMAKDVASYVPAERWQMKSMVEEPVAPEKPSVEPERIPNGILGRLVR